MGKHLELQLPHCGQHRSRITEERIPQNLHHALLVKLVQAFAELLEPPSI